MALDASVVRGGLKISRRPAADSLEHEKQVFDGVEFSEECGSLEQCHLVIGNLVDLAQRSVIAESTPPLPPGRL